MSPEEAAQRAAAAAAEKQRYEQLKTEFQGWTLLLGVLGTATCYFCYTKDVAISYALGASSGLTYLRLLSRTVDAGACDIIFGSRLLISLCSMQCNQQGTHSRILLAAFNLIFLLLLLKADMDLISSN